MRTRIIECIQDVLRQHNCYITADQHYSDDCWINVNDIQDQETVSFDLITADTFEETTI